MFNFTAYSNRYKMLNCFGKNLSPPIFFALKNRSIELVEYTLERIETDPNIRNTDGKHYKFF